MFLRVERAVVDAADRDVVTESKLVRNVELEPARADA